MTAGAETPLADALLAARLCALDSGLGGMMLRGGGECRETVVATLRASLPAAAPLRRVPAGVDDVALLGGLDLGATLGLGRAVTRAGLLAEAAGGIVVVPSAERMPDALAAKITAATRALVVGFDDGIDDERPPPTLLERLAFHLDLSNARLPPVALVPAAAPAERTISASGEAAGAVLAAIATTAQALGVGSARAAHFALRAARASAALAGRDAIAEADLTLAVRLVLAPRATRLPEMPSETPSGDPPPPPKDAGDGEDRTPQPLDDIVLAAALAALPPDLLARLAAGRSRASAPRARGAGERRRSPRHGRPLGARAGLPRDGLRLSLIDTLRAAAPWQAQRGRETRIRLRRDDLRVRRFETRAEATTIVAVDASGSSALARLAEAKGAVELLLAQAYVQRAQVALISFRGDRAELLLPPTRSLARARRCLADLPGGGGTPLAAGLSAAHALADAARRRGRTPFVVLLTDGRANVAADGSPRRAAAQADAEAAARAIAAAGIAAAFVDISPRVRPEAAALAAAMRARYLPLPRADAAAMHAAIRAARPA